MSCMSRNGLALTGASCVSAGDSTGSGRSTSVAVGALVIAEGRLCAHHAKAVLLGKLHLGDRLRFSLTASCTQPDLGSHGTLQRRRGAVARVPAALLDPHDRLGRSAVPNELYLALEGCGNHRLETLDGLT